MLSKVFHNFSHNSLWQKLWETGRRSLWATLWSAPETFPQSSPSTAQRLRICRLLYSDSLLDGSQLRLEAAHMEDFIAGPGQDRIHEAIPLLPGFGVVAAVIQLQDEEHVQLLVADDKVHMFALDLIQKGLTLLSIGPLFRLN